MNPKTTYRTKSDVAYSVLKEEILSGKLRPGESLTLRALAGRLGMSEIPVREALQRLGPEGLVVIVPHVGAKVSDLAIEDIAENLLIRAELEGLAAALAAGHVTESVLQRLRALVDTMEMCVLDNDLEQFGELNRRFHQAMYEVLPNRQLTQLITDLWNQVPRARTVFALIPQHTEESHREHKEILAALEARDGERARALVRKQKLRARHELLRLAHTSQAPVGSRSHSTA